MKNRIIRMLGISLFSCLLIFTIASCANGASNETGSKEAVNVISSEPISTDASEAATTKAETTAEQGILEKTYKIPGKQIYVDVPKLKELEQGYSELFWKENQYCYVVQSPSSDKVPFSEQSFETIFPVLKKCIYSNISINEIADSAQEEITVNGRKMYKIVGHFNCGDPDVYEAPFVAYVFGVEDNSAMIVGLVMDREQTDATFEEVCKISEAMANSVREEK